MPPLSEKPLPSASSRTAPQPLPARCIIAGTHSGCGKTTVTTALLAALSGRGSQRSAFTLPRVRAFKVGPDYIDPSFHEFVTGNPSRNLDAWLCSPERMQHIFLHGMREADIAVIEGVMGLFDGVGASVEGSTAHVARVLDAPVVLVVNGSGMAGSIAAVVRGYRGFDPLLRLAGVVVSQCGGARHAALLRRAVEAEGVRFFGALPKDAAFTLKRRHLGLVPAPEVPHLAALVTALADAAWEYLDIPALLACAGLPVDTGFVDDANTASVPPGGEIRLVTSCLGVEAGHTGSQGSTGVRWSGSSGVPLLSKPDYDSMYVLEQSSKNELWGRVAARQEPCDGLPSEQKEQGRGYIAPRGVTLRIGVARDAAFSFYYQDNLELLQTLGAHLEFFSPLHAASLPEHLDGLYLGGGFPEVFASELSANRSMLASMRDFLESGAPAYAECGALMYLCRALVLADGARYPMVGFFEPEALMATRLQHFGYVTLRALQDTPLLRRWETTRAHEFHHSRLVDGDGEPWKLGQDTAAFEVIRPDGEHWWGGLQRLNVLGGYPHVHFYSNGTCASRFMELCGLRRKEQVVRV